MSSSSDFYDSDNDYDLEEEEDVDIANNSDEYDASYHNNQSQDQLKRFSHIDVFCNQIKSSYFKNKQERTNANKSSIFFNQFNDAIFIVGKKEIEIKVIRLLLSLRSEYFQALFANKNFNQNRKSIKINNNSISDSNHSNNSNDRISPIKTRNMRKRALRETDDITDNNMKSPPKKKQRLNKSNKNDESELKGLDCEDSTNNNNNNDNNGAKDSMLAVYYEPDIDVSTFNFIKKYCYGVHDDLSIGELNVCEILRASDKYLLNELRNECLHYIRSNTTINNVIPLLLKISKVNEIEIYFEEAISRISWLNDDNGKKLLDLIAIPLSKGQLSIELFIQLFLSNNNFNIKEELLYQACVNYCKQNITDTYNSNNNSSNNSNNSNSINSWQSMMREHFIKYIRFPRMDKEYFINLFNASDSENEKLLTYKQICQILILSNNFGSDTMNNCELLKDCVFSNEKRCKYSDEQLNILRNNRNGSNQVSFIKYGLTANEYESHSSYSNTSEALLRAGDFMDGAATIPNVLRPSHKTWMQFKFDRLYYISMIKFAPLDRQSSALGLGPACLDGATIEYFDQQERDWLQLVEIKIRNKYDASALKVYTYDLKSISTSVVITQYLRVVSPKAYHSFGLSCFIPYGYRAHV